MIRHGIRDAQTIDYQAGEPQSLHATTTRPPEARPVSGLKARVEKAPCATIKIYQNYFRDDQVPLLDPDFVPHDWTHNPHPEYRETIVFLDAYRRGRHLEADYVGIVSWKFGQKTGITGKQFKAFIERNPGYDVYFINPFPYEGYQFNIWTQGERNHPGLWSLAQDLFDTAGYPVNLLQLGRMDRRTLLYCNYWVGNRAFWDTYIAFVEPLFECIVHRMTATTRERYFARAKYPDVAPFFPFIFERMFSTLLLIKPDIRVCFYPHLSETDPRDQGAIRAAKSLFRYLVEQMDRTPFIRGNTPLFRGVIEQLLDGYGTFMRVSDWYTSLLQNVTRGRDRSPGTS